MRRTRPPGPGPPVPSARRSGLTDRRRRRSVAHSRTDCGRLAPMAKRAIILVLDSFGIGATRGCRALRRCRRGYAGPHRRSLRRRPCRQERRARRAACAFRTWRAGALAARRRFRPAPFRPGWRRTASTAPMAAPPRTARARTRRADIGKWPAARSPFDWGYFPRERPCFPPALIDAAGGANSSCPASSATARLGHRDHRRAGRGAYPDRQADLLHLGRQRVPGRGARDSISDWSGSIASASAPRNCWSRSTSAA